MIILKNKQKKVGSHNGTGHSDAYVFHKDTREEQRLINFCASQTQHRVWYIVIGTNQYLLNRMLLYQRVSFLITTFCPIAFKETDRAIVTGQKPKAMQRIQ